MKDFGYLVVISKSSTNEYLSMAYLLALSIKATQKQGYDKVALITDDKETIPVISSSPVFNQVIFWDKKQHWDGRSYMDQLSPWRYTVCLDADMLMVRDTSHWIDYFINSNTEIYVTNKVKTFRDDIVTDNFYRQTYEKNQLPILYSAYTFFDKTSLIVEKFFNMGRYIIDYPTEFKNYFLDKDIPEVVGTDEAFSLAAKILDLEDTISYDLEFPRFVHLKPRIQGFKTNVQKMGKEVGYYFDKLNRFKIGSFNQTDIIHYSQKDLFTQDMISNYHNIMMENFKNVT
jgi:hypothetical protein